jgi:F0F1-type ATP synthase assembly protein I
MKRNTDWNKIGDREYGMNSESPNSGTQDKKKKVEIQGTYREYGPYLTLGFQLAAAVVLFFLIGHWIDNRYGIEPVGKLVGVLIGSIGGFVKFFKSVASLTADKEKQLGNKKRNED